MPSMLPVFSLQVLIGPAQSSSLHRICLEAQATIRRTASHPQILHTGRFVPSLLPSKGPDPAASRSAHVHTSVFSPRCCLLTSFHWVFSPAAKPSVVSTGIRLPGNPAAAPEHGKLLGL